MKAPQVITAPDCCHEPKCDACEGSGLVEVFCTGHAPMIDQPTEDAPCEVCGGRGHVLFETCEYCGGSVRLLLVDEGREQPACYCEICLPQEYPAAVLSEA